MDKSTKPKTTSTTKPKDIGEDCLLHYGKTLQSVCHDHSNFCCKVCLKTDHKACHTEKLSKLAGNIKDSQELADLNKKLNTLKKGFNDTLKKTQSYETVISGNISSSRQ